MNILIPTVGRTLQYTADTLIRAGITPILVIPDTQARLEGYTRVVRIKKEGIRATRQWILDSAEDKVVMMDDDLRFYARRGKEWFKAESVDIRIMVRALEQMLNIYAHGGIAAKFMSHTLVSPYTLNSKYYHVLAYNKKLFPEVHPKFRLEIGEDHDMNLQLLTSGRSNFVLTDWAKDDKEHAPGGCDTWRTKEMEFREAERLEESWPDFVTLDGARPKIRWKKAAEVGNCDTPRFPRLEGKCIDIGRNRHSVSKSS